jgi:hypothetical protein
MDDIVVWCASMDNKWHSNVVQLLAFTVDDDLPVSKKVMVKECSEIKVSVSTDIYIQ